MAIREDVSVRKGWSIWWLGIALLLFAVPSHAGALPGGSLDPTSVDKYIMPLIIPPEMPPAETRINQTGQKIDYYEIEVVQFNQQILPAGLPETPVWSYGAVGHPETRNYPAFTIEARVNKPTRVKWINNLVDSDGNYIPHLLGDVVDQTLHWANPPAGEAGKDRRGNDPAPYLGPVPIVTHVHGAHVGPESDGYPEAWWLPDAENIDPTFATRGSLWDQIDGALDTPGAALYQYPNDQAATTLWYHDHTLGMTRLNVYAGPAGFWLIRDDDEAKLKLPGPAPKIDDAYGNDPLGDKYYEIPIVMQDRSFNADGTLFYPDNRAFFEELSPEQLDIDFIPDSDISPIWNPEAFFNTMVVNGRTWPYQEVEPRKYRLRLLNGCNSRFLIVKLVSDPMAERPAAAAMPFSQIGADGGLLEAPVMQQQLLMAPAERADVVVDFSGLAPGTEIYLINEGPDEPFGGGVPGTDFDAADPGTSGQVMKFTVIPLSGKDKSKLPAKLTKVERLQTDLPFRRVSLNEEESGAVCVYEDGEILRQDRSVLAGESFHEDCEAAGGEVFAPKAALLGTVNGAGAGVPLLWSADITENPQVGDTEVWEIYNFTEDAHPIHLHLVQFQVVNRQPIGGTVYGPEAGETAFKDTVIAYPGEITRIIANFDMEGLYVWHCHIVEHEDNEMMRPYYVGPAENSPVPVASEP